MSGPMRLTWLTDFELRVMRYRLRQAAQAAKAAVKRRGVRIHPRVAKLKAKED